MIGVERATRERTPDRPAGRTNVRILFRPGRTRGPTCPAVGAHAAEVPGAGHAGAVVEARARRALVQLCNQREDTRDSVRWQRNTKSFPTEKIRPSQPTAGRERPGSPRSQRSPAQPARHWQRGAPPRSTQAPPAPQPPAQSSIAATEIKHFEWNGNIFFYS